MSNSKVLLTTLSVRTSSKGRPYLAGWLGKASLVAFEGEPDKFGHPTWDLFLSGPEPQDRPPQPARAPQAREVASAHLCVPSSPGARPGAPMAAQSASSPRRPHRGQGGTA
jgi:hypothetical protein